MANHRHTIKKKGQSQGQGQGQNQPRQSPSRQPRQLSFALPPAPKQRQGAWKRFSLPRHLPPSFPLAKVLNYKWSFLFYGFILGLVAGLVIGTSLSEPEPQTTPAPQTTAPALATPAAQPPAPSTPSRTPSSFLPEEPSQEHTTIIKTTPAPAPQKPKTSPHRWQQNALKVPAVPSDTPVIAIVIDDLGIDRKHTDEVIALPAPLTTSFITYADDLPQQMEHAKEMGKELMLHLPMQPLNDKIDTGPNALVTSMTKDEIKATLKKALPKYLLDIGVAGVNNHMGSRFTSDKHSMESFFAAFAPYDLFFIDSFTTSSSVALGLADKKGIAAASRNVFIDNQGDDSTIPTQLKTLEQAAKLNGYAIGIGHPHAGTIAALKAWLPTLKAKGFVLVPASYVITRRRGQSTPSTP